MLKMKIYSKRNTKMNRLSPRRALSGGALIILHICLPLILISLLAASAQCISIEKHDPVWARYMFLEAAQYALSSILLCLVGAIIPDIAEHDRKRR